jgi:O-methyltransferase involved in polyketide biosynthesis
VLGAGLDTFAYRQPDWARRLKIVEIDHPASQQFKIASLKSAGIVRTVANGYLSRSHATITATPVTVQAKPVESRTAKSDPREPTR